jgi:hypothetical protein
MLDPTEYQGPLPAEETHAFPNGLFIAFLVVVFLVFLRWRWLDKREKKRKQLNDLLND